MLQKGIIVSIQGYSKEMTQEMAKRAILGGAVAIRTDQDIEVSKPVIGLKKNRDVNPRDVGFITNSLVAIKEVSEWADIIAIDYRRMNSNLKELAEYCKNNGILVIADIGEFEDYTHIRDNGLYYTYIATTLSPFYNRETRYKPDFNLLYKLHDAGERMIIGEGNFSHRGQVRQAYPYCNNICVGAGISDIESLTRKFTSVRFE